LVEPNTSFATALKPAMPSKSPENPVYSLSNVANAAISWALWT
jgi:hypothetical protein